MNQGDPETKQQPLYSSHHRWTFRTIPNFPGRVPLTPLDTVVYHIIQVLRDWSNFWSPEEHKKENLGREELQWRPTPEDDGPTGREVSRRTGTEERTRGPLHHLSLVSDGRTVPVIPHGLGGCSTQLYLRTHGRSRDDTTEGTDSGLLGRSLKVPERTVYYWRRQIPTETSWDLDHPDPERSSNSHTRTLPTTGSRPPTTTHTGKDRDTWIHVGRDPHTVF